jgi:hypothetical protein
MRIADASYDALTPNFSNLVSVNIKALLSLSRPVEVLGMGTDTNAPTFCSFSVLIKTSRLFLYLMSELSPC